MPCSTLFCSFFFLCPYLLFLLIFFILFFFLSVFHSCSIYSLLLTLFSSFLFLCPYILFLFLLSIIFLQFMLYLFPSLFFLFYLSSILAFTFLFLISAKNILKLILAWLLSIHTHLLFFCVSTDPHFFVHRYQWLMLFIGFAGPLYKILVVVKYELFFCFVVMSLCNRCEDVQSGS